MKHIVVDPQLAAVPLLEGLSQRELEFVSRSVTRITVPPGHMVAREGRRGNEFMVVLDGTVDVCHDGRVVATRGRCDYIGEIALLTGRPRTATVVTTSAVTLDVIARREFLALVDEIPRVTERMRAAMPDRMAQLAT
jgi:CRP-like cAMP-binding protein